MLGANAVECYGFDPAKLAPVAARVGPEVGDVGAGSVRHGP